MQLKLWKYDGAGNDFVALDGRKGPFTGGLERSLIRTLCNRKRGIGADGVLLLLNCDDKDCHFRMVYYNADGSEGEMCGNGARCIVRFASDLGIIEKVAHFMTGAGKFRAEIMDNGPVILDFPDLGNHPETIKFEGEPTPFDATYQVVGVPHAVVWVRSLSTYEVAKVGKRLRSSPSVGSAGANVNFAEVKNDETIMVRTYERGVEEETLACGTGSVATAISHAIKNGRTGDCQYTIIPTSRDNLLVSFTVEADKISNVKLGGPARLVFHTEVKVDSESLLVSA